jgi:hypothetical protein
MTVANNTTRFVLTSLAIVSACPSENYQHAVGESKSVSCGRDIQASLSLNASSRSL